LNVSDEDAEKFIKYFTLLDRETIESLILEHREAPHKRILQKALAREVTVQVHSEEDHQIAVEASEILFGKGTTDVLKRLSEQVFLNIFEGVPLSEISRSTLSKGIGILDFLTEETGIFASKGEARRMIKDNGVSLNKQKVRDDFQVGQKELLNEKYILIQKGKRNYFLVKAI
jgi:tyrosyl-tRNA synthetase